MELFGLLTLGALMWISKATGDIRCYCNDADCVNTGYTCHSAIGRCFSQLSYEATDSARSRHGCAESLPTRDRSMCESEGDIIKTKNGPDEEWPLLMCCKEDMCNYQESLDINIYVDTKSNGSIQKGDKPGSHDPFHLNGGGESRGRPGDVLWPVNNNYGISQRDLWFKAAVIAVPIAGGFILILLVLLAVRMLRNDSRRQRNLMHIHQQRSLTKAQLYVADHFYHNETECLKNNAAVQCGGQIYHGNGVAVNGNHPFRDCHEITSCPSHHCDQHSQVYQDVSVKLDKKGYEKMRPWSDSSTTSTAQDEAGSVNSVVLWNGSDPPKRPPNRATNV